MPKEIKHDHIARTALTAGLDAVADTVKRTLGPAGRNVVLERKFGAPQIVNDGVTIAKEIDLKDHLENAGAQLMREVCIKTNDTAGDGTTTAAVLAQAIIHEGLKNIAAGANPMILRRGILRAAEDVTRELKASARKVDSNEAIRQIATISSGNEEEFGVFIAQAMAKVGTGGVIAVETAQALETELKFVEGMEFDKGFPSAYFITDGERQECVLESPFILCVNKRVNLIAEIVQLLEKVARAQRPLLIIAEEIEGEALATLVVNNLRKTLSCCAVKAPGFGDRRADMLEDIAILTGATVITDQVGHKLESTELAHLGRAHKVIVTKEKTTIIAQNPETELKVAARIKTIKSQLEKTESEFDKEKLTERLGKLEGKAAVIRVGGATETEIKDKKLRLEDALNATKAAVEEGYVAGGGAAFVHIAKRLEACDVDGPGKDFRVGYDAVLKAIQVPLQQIANNAGYSGEVVLEYVRKGKGEDWYGFDVIKGQYGAMHKEGIIDPAKVERCALQNAASIAAMFLTTESIVVDIPEPAVAGPQMPGHGPGFPMM